MSKDDIKRYQRRLLRLRKRLGGDLSMLEEEVLRPVGGEAAGGLSDVPVHPPTWAPITSKQSSR